ncbi:MAG: hypothetical protein UZ10_BCD003000534 [Bacteroidetes bacterium OLB10]|nr:MAG: hypothetical protein UZ10_BCD003000534 [Bacteroidetes bacterium OLB10]
MMNYMLNRMNCFAVVFIVAMAGSCKSSKKHNCRNQIGKCNINRGKNYIA